MTYTVDLNYLDERGKLEFRRFEDVDSKSSVTDGVVTIVFATYCVFIVPVARLISMEMYPSE